MKFGSAYREFVGQRLGELKRQRCQLETRIEELDRLSLSRDEINSIVTDSMKFLAGLEFVRERVPQEKLVECPPKTGPVLMRV